MEPIQEQLRQWADKTARAYHKLAIDPNHPECNLAFYTQSDLSGINSRPELLILGINPADKYKTRYTDGDGHSQMENIKYWGIPDGMTGEKLLRGNPSIRSREDWTIWKGLRSIFRHGNIEKELIESESVYTNLILFATEKASDIPAKAYDNETYTYELVDILQPEIILCLGKVCRERLGKRVAFREIVANELYAGSLGNSLVYAIPHPSNRWTNAEKEVVGSILGYLFGLNKLDAIVPERVRELFAPEIDTWKNGIATPSAKIDFKDLCKGVEARFGKPFECNDKTVRYQFTSETALTITTAGLGYAGIRARYVVGPDWNANLANKDGYIHILRDCYHWCEGKTWLAIKRFRDVGSIDEFCEELAEIQLRFEQNKQ